MASKSKADVDKWKRVKKTAAKLIPKLSRKENHIRIG